MYSWCSYLRRLGGFWRRPAAVPRHCIFDRRYGCVIPQPIPTQNLGTSFDTQVMAGNCGYAMRGAGWWHVHHSAPAFQGGIAQTCPHSYRPGQQKSATFCQCQTFDIWKDKLVPPLD